MTTLHIVTIRWPGFAVKTRRKNAKLLIFVYSQFICIPCYFLFPVRYLQWHLFDISFRGYENKRKQLKRLIM